MSLHPELWLLTWAQLSPGGPAEAPGAQRCQRRGQGRQAQRAPCGASAALRNFICKKQNPALSSAGSNPSLLEGVVVLILPLSPRTERGCSAPQQLAPRSRPTLHNPSRSRKFRRQLRASKNSVWTWNLFEINSRACWDPDEDTHKTPELQLLTTQGSGDLFCKEKQEQQKDSSEL